MKRRIRLFSTSLFLLIVLLGVPVLLTWRAVRQERRDRALIASIRKDDIVGVVSLLTQGADANARDAPPDTRPLWRQMLDRLHGRPSPSDRAPTAILAALESYEFIPSFPNGYVRSYTQEDLPLFTALLDRGANINVRDEYGDTPLMLAAWSGKCRTVRLLLDRGADIHAHGEYGNTVLTEPALSTEMLRLLLQRGADVNAQGFTGQTALMSADTPEAVQLLLAKGANVSIKDTSGHTALWYAEQSRQTEIIRLLKQADAKERDRTRQEAHSYFAGK